MLKTTPAVFAVSNEYQIMVEIRCEAFISVKVGNKRYYDASNGIMNSQSPIHRVSVPIQELDREKEYTVFVRPVIERKPYFTETANELAYTFHFTPIPEENIRIYHISDTHNEIDRPVAAAKVFGAIDLLILNGDIIDNSGSPDKFINIYEICAQLTKGTIPVIFSRGNHDMRGMFANKFAEYTPSQYQNTYYTFRLGSIWGILLDCGEDKEDGHDAYGHCIACHPFRERQTEFIRSIIKNASTEYDAPGVKTRLVISHIPFTMLPEAPFNIEGEIYQEWASLLKEHIKPDLMICGHEHKYSINPVGSPNDYYGQPCTMIVAAEPQAERFIGCGFIINDKKIDVVFTDSLGKTLTQDVISRK